MDYFFSGMPSPCATLPWRQLPMDLNLCNCELKYFQGNNPSELAGTPWPSPLCPPPPCHSEKRCTCQERPAVSLGDARGRPSPRIVLQAKPRTQAPVRRREGPRPGPLWDSLDPLDPRPPRPTPPAHPHPCRPPRRSQRAPRTWP
ncbi:uncharacterized protein LOC134472768 [Cavia porcellus]|uniref:uncharacterized protein LOC134472768 n=1 Tax=Cavia porcellus TaxID=10141 RepID=UPI002FDF8B39